MPALRALERLVSLLADYGAFMVHKSFPIKIKWGEEWFEATVVLSDEKSTDNRYKVKVNCGDMVFNVDNTSYVFCGDGVTEDEFQRLGPLIGRTYLLTKKYGCIFLTDVEGGKIYMISLDKVKDLKAAYWAMRQETPPPPREEKRPDFDDLY